MGFVTPIGIDDFVELRQQRATYVDKTAWIAEWLREGAKVCLFPRPRRFGKTLNLSTMRAFLARGDDAEARARLFEGLHIAGDEAAQAHFARYPVIQFSLKGIKPQHWDECVDATRALIADLVAEHRQAFDNPSLSPMDRDVLVSLMKRQGTRADWASALLRLSRALATHYGEPVVILIDEYDTPIHAAWLNGYYDEAIDFFRTFYGEGLKGNSHMFRGVVTGILRVAKESIFSDVNNLKVHDMLHRRFATAFGFTAAEVLALARTAGAEERLPELAEWYDGYDFAGHAIYNPWSVINALDDFPAPPQPHWRYTSSDAILARLLRRHGASPTDWQTLLEGGTIRGQLLPSVPLRELERKPNAVWSFLLFSGYLTASNVDPSGANIKADLRIPNREVRGVYESVFAAWLDDALGAQDNADVLAQAILRGDAPVVADHLTTILLEQASYHDFPWRRAEELYHAFTQGLLARLGGEYRVRSNPESGYGRADLLLIPKLPGRPGAVIELKAPIDGLNVDQALDDALAQIERKDYRAELRAAGAHPIAALALVFEAGRAHVRAA